MDAKRDCKILCMSFELTDPTAGMMQWLEPWKMFTLWIVTNYTLFVFLIKKYSDFLASVVFSLQRKIKFHISKGLLLNKGNFSSSLLLLFILQYCFSKTAPQLYRQRVNKTSFKRLFGFCLFFKNDEAGFSVQGWKPSFSILD